ncbi:hypothetical protein [Stenotrophomonas sp. PS02297]|uniref:hypothetical protein n=1 Tax=unclassified Stenotrophomonas TaxID=196198 RepID=UPI00249AC17E|nr:hypothetical protein [Stenotrophomonas sp. PS02297]
MTLKVTRGPQVGECNICGTCGPMTVDHTPPKGWAPCVPMQVMEVMEPLKESQRHKYQKVNDGVRFRSLCERCNRDVLGTLYDPELLRLVDAVTALPKTSLHIPGVQFVRIRPQRVMRSVIGHLCAQGVNRYKKGDITQPLRDYLLDPALPLPDMLSLHYWLFPFPTVVLTKDARIMNLVTRQNSILWSMKCFPLGFALTDRDYVFDGVPPQHKMNPYRHKGVDDFVELPVDLITFPPRPFPEHPADNSMIAY